MVVHVGLQPIVPCFVVTSHLLDGVGSGAAGLVGNLCEVLGDK